MLSDDTKADETLDDIVITLAPCEKKITPKPKEVNPGRPVTRLGNESIVWLDIRTYNAIKEHAEENPGREVGGFLLGYTVKGENYVDIYIAASLKAHGADEKRASLTFTHASWDRLNEERLSFYPDYKVVGWYHTHPGYSAFYSSDDIFIQKNFFAGPEFVGMVIDPLRQEEKFYKWIGELISVKSKISALTGAVRSPAIAIKEISRRQDKK